MHWQRRAREASAAAAAAAWQHLLLLVQLLLLRSLLRGCLPRRPPCGATSCLSAPARQSGWQLLIKVRMQAILFSSLW